MVEKYSKENSDVTYSIFVYASGVANGTNVAIVEGNDGSGYYGTGFTLNVIEAK